MSRTRFLAVLALLPAAALAQTGALDAARAGKETQERADARTVERADAAVKSGDTADPGAAAKPTDDASRDTAAVDAPAPAAPGDGALGLPIEGSAVAADEGRGTVPPPDTYTVRPGDTLWDLSGRFLNNPWYWPKIWSYNPDITNPHWIYPGNVLKFFPAADEAPARVEPVAAAEPNAAEAEPDEAAPPRELEDFSKANLKEPESAEESDTVAVAGPYKIGYVAPKALLARHDTFVTPRELAESGAVTAAFEEKLLLSTLDRAYARFKVPADVKAGETYVIYKTERQIQHPRTGELFGWQSTVLGAGKVVAVDGKVATLVITQAFDPIERGAMLGPWTEKFLKRVERRANRQEMAGTIIGGQVDVLTQLGEHHVVFLDRGQKDGVEEGNVFSVVRSGDPYGRSPYQASWDRAFPIETIGELLVIDVKERASAALVTRSRIELLIGDRVLMRAAGQAAAGAGGR
ncbi:MAG TPA: LysM domain-containing protein [Anaeromyxobacter sp.]|nr:LysM domain-containing protein [Anaeromyxobacter sp.]